MTYCFIKLLPFIIIFIWYKYKLLVYKWRIIVYWYYNQYPLFLSLTIWLMLYFFCYLAYLFTNIDCSLLVLHFDAQGNPTSHFSDYSSSVGSTDTGTSPGSQHSFGSDPDPGSSSGAGEASGAGSGESSDADSGEGSGAGSGEGSDADSGKDSDADTGADTGSDPGSGSVLGSGSGSGLPQSTSCNLPQTESEKSPTLSYRPLPKSPSDYLGKDWK